MPALAGVPNPAPGRPRALAGLGAGPGTGDIWDMGKVLNLRDVVQPSEGLL